jgi:exodeoxyribonuclease VII large subunit
MEKDYIDLFEFQSRLKKGVECLFPSRIWIRAEISAVKARQGGHCWLELSQSDGSGLVAKASAVIWSSRYRFIAPYFESVTGSPLSEGMYVLVEVQVNYSQLYGMSLVVNDVDAEFSLGVRELERQRTIGRLKKEGLMDLQKGLEVPVLPYKFAVVSAEDAAGYRDFVKHLQENPFGFTFDLTLFPALMQGVDCPSSVISALDAVLDSGVDYDAVLLMRGGGAKLDLACFDDYDLAAVIAQYPLPVYTAIGHDQDHHVCDMVAYASVKTPTALADEILSIYEDEDARLFSLMTRIRMALSGRLSVAEAALSVLRARIYSGFSVKIAALDSALQVLQARIRAADPERVLERGYSLVLDGSGRVMKGTTGFREGDDVRVRFADGTLDCVVRSVAGRDDKRN